MSVSMKNLDPAFQGAGQKAGIEIWYIENSKPVAVPASSYGKFFTEDSYVILKTIASKSGGLHHDIHYWLGKDTSEDEAGTATVKTIELDATLGSRAVEYREVQGHETEKFLSYFRPCIIPQEGTIASGAKQAETEEHTTRLYACRGKHVVYVKEVPFVRSSLNHDNIFVLDTKSKIFQFNGSNTSIQERAKALEVVQHIQDTHHDGKCDIAAIEGGKLMADAESGEFWALFGGFAPLPKKTASDDDKSADLYSTRLLRVVKGEAQPVDADSLTRELLETNTCYVLDCGLAVFVWMGRNTSLDDRKSASGAAEELVSGSDRPPSHIIRVMEGFETAMFKSKFDSWPKTIDVAGSEDGRGKIAALLRGQGVKVKGLLKAEPVQEETEIYIDCTGNLQMRPACSRLATQLGLDAVNMFRKIWRVNGEDKILLPDNDMSKFYSGDCYLFHYSYGGDDKEEYIVGTWFGKQSVEEERTSALSQAGKMVEAQKFLPIQARIHEGSEPVLFFLIMQSLVIFKGGLSDGYKNYIAENELPDETYQEDGVALFRIQGSGPDNMQAIQVEPVATSLNSSYCFILHSGSTVFTWNGSLANSDDQELVERQLDVIKPNLQSRPQKEGAEFDSFWDIIGGKKDHPKKKIAREKENDPHLFSCSFSEGNLKAKEIYNFTQDDLMTEDVFTLDIHSEIFVWVGQQANSKNKPNALSIGEKFLEHDFLLENLSREIPIYVVVEGSEPSFFTRFFTWDSGKPEMLGNSFQRKLAIVKSGGTPVAAVKPKRRKNASYGGRSGVPEKPQRSRSVTFSPERARKRGRSPAFNALAATFEGNNPRNLSTPPPMSRKLYPKSGTAESDPDTKSAAIAALTATFEKSAPTREKLMPRTVKASLHTVQSTPELTAKEINICSRSLESLTIEEDTKEGETEEDDEGPIYPYDRLRTESEDPVTEIDVTRRETYLSSQEFREKFGMGKDKFYKMPKWKQNKQKMALHLF